MHEYVETMDYEVVQMCKGMGTTNMWMDIPIAMTIIRASRKRYESSNQLEVEAMCDRQLLAAEGKLSNDT